MGRKTLIRAWRPAIAAMALWSLGASMPVYADVTIGGDVGIGKHYRPGGWIPVTVYVRKTDSDAIHGQVQAYADPDPGNKSRQNRMGMVDPGPPPAVFSTTATLAGPANSTTAYRLYIRNIDPVEDNLTLQYRTGDDRGDGSVLARLPMDNTAVKNNMGGTPLDGADPWIISLAPDPSAFVTVNGRKIGLIHTHSGPRWISTLPRSRGNNSFYYGNNGRLLQAMNSLIAPAVQVTPAAVPDLPDKAAGYSGVDAVFLRCDAPLAALTEAQTDALRAWVASGGHLLVTSGADPSGFSTPFLHDMLPASIDPLPSNIAFPHGNIGLVSAVPLTPKPLPGVRVFKTWGSRPVVVSGPFGAGRVTVVAFDPTTQPFRMWMGRDSDLFWRDLITGGDTAPSTMLAYIGAREEADSAYMTYGDNSQLADQVLKTPSLDAPEVGSIAMYLVIYIIVLVPLNYLVLKRLDRREWAWITIPALVFLFAGATYAIGYAGKGNAMFVNRITVAETSAGSREAGVYSAFGIFSPHRSTYDIDVHDGGALVCQPNTFRSFYGSRPQADDLSDANPARFLQGASEPHIQDASINMWAMRTFDLSTAVDLGGAVTVHVARMPGGGLRGTVQNGTGYTLTGGYFCYHDQSQSVGDLPAGTRANVQVARGSTATRITPSGDDVNIASFPKTAFANVNNANEYAASDNVESRMTSGTVDFLNSVSDDDNDYWPAQSTGEPRITYRPRSGEAIFAAWAQGSGPLDTGISVDGRPAQENNVTLVIVHVPIEDAGGGH